MTQWNILCGRYDGIEKRAAHRLKACIEEHLDLTAPAGIFDLSVCRDLPEGRNIFLGMGDENPYAPHKGENRPEEYTITVTDTDPQTLSITGADANGLLYGVVDFIGKYIPSALYSNTSGSPYYMHSLFTEAPMKPCLITSAPAIARRGLWTWGHTITDYRGYIDNMVSAKMNTLVIWNNLRPANAKDVAEYAHENGIKLLYGFAWGWGTNNHTAEGIRYALEHKQDIVDEYLRDWASSGCDGIYFQSFTETSHEKIGDILIADAVTEYVNYIAGEIWKHTPGVTIQFGLHATSVHQKLDFIARTDPRIEIVWEDCGAFPFAYTPNRVGEDDFSDTLALAEDISTLRGEDDRFGCVFKGLICLNWNKFKYPANPYLIGEASEALKKARLAEKRPIWRYVQAYWMENAWYAQTTFRHLCDRKNGNFTALSLVEDGMFESALWFPVLLCGELLWNPYADTQTLLRETALNPAAVFA
ncbi:MAG: hypothetical protein E7631_12005 [Ruminococcaceae bacterium]|nr:hypothetical protein [Oscillospiraceae bacterium]